METISPKFFEAYAENKWFFIQKFIYFLQESGYDLGFKFDWYNSGPYSLELRECEVDIYENKLYEQKRFIQLTDTAIKDIVALKQTVFGKYETNNAYLTLEILASLHFLKKHNFIFNNKSKDCVIDAYIDIKKPTKSREELVGFYNLLVMSGLLK